MKLYHCLPFDYYTEQVRNGVFSTYFSGIFLADTDKGAIRGCQRKYEGFALMTVLCFDVDEGEIELWNNTLTDETYGDNFYFWKVKEVPSDRFEVVATFPLLMDDIKKYKTA